MSTQIWDFSSISYFSFFFYLISSDYIHIYNFYSWYIVLFFIYLYGCLGYPVHGPRPSYLTLGPRPPKNFQSAHLPPSQSPVTTIMCTLLLMVYGLFKPCWLTHATCTCFKETALLLNMHLSCFVNFILCPTEKYMFKVNNKKIRLICWMCSKLKLGTTWHRSGVFIVDFDQSQSM